MENRAGIRNLTLLWGLLLWSSLVWADVDVNSDTVGNWANDLFGQALEERRLSGAVLTVVRDGEIIYNSGFGFADYLKEIPVDPERTQFRIGSTTKVFTAIAIAQLMESGLISSLDDPANMYLKRDQLPKHDGKDITLRQLVTHSGGFASRASGIGTVEVHDLPVTAAKVRERRVPIVRNPGGRSVYSNYGTALLGIMVEDLTGMKIADYFDKKIFEPLGMSRSTLNMKPGATEGLAQPYAFFPNGQLQRIEHMGIHPFYGPVGSINATGADMGRFMISQLDAGNSGSSPLGISPAGFSRLHSRIHGNHSAVNGFGMVFLTGEWAGETGFGHGGDWEGFHSLMWMWPQRNVGVFFSLMAESPTTIGALEGILGSERLTPDPDNPVLPPMRTVGTFLNFTRHFFGPDTPQENNDRIPVDELAGSYRSEARAYGTVMEFVEVLMGGTVIPVEPVGDGQLMIGDTGPYRQIAKGVFWDDSASFGLDGYIHDSDLWAFAWDDDEQLYHLSPRLGIAPSTQVGALNNPAFYAGLLGIAFIVLLTGPGALFWRVESMSHRAVKYSAVLAPLFVIAIVASLLLFYPEGDYPAAYLLRGDAGRFLLSIVFANLAALACLILAVGAVYTWVSPAGSGIVRRIHVSLLGLASIMMLMVLSFSNYIGSNLP